MVEGEVLGWKWLGVSAATPVNPVDRITKLMKKKIPRSLWVFFIWFSTVPEGFSLCAMKF